METQHFVEYLCLTCGLQGLRTAAETGDRCPRCGEKMLTINRPTSKTAYSATV